MNLFRVKIKVQSKVICLNEAEIINPLTAYSALCVTIIFVQILMSVVWWGTCARTVSASTHWAPITVSAKLVTPLTSPAHCVWVRLTFTSSIYALLTTYLKFSFLLSSKELKLCVWTAHTVLWKNAARVCPSHHLPLWNFWPQTQKLPPSSTFSVSPSPSRCGWVHTGTEAV